MRPGHDWIALDARLAPAPETSALAALAARPCRPPLPAGKPIRMTKDMPAAPPSETEARTPLSSAPDRPHPTASGADAGGAPFDPVPAYDAIARVLADSTLGFHPRIDHLLALLADLFNADVALLNHDDGKVMTSLRTVSPCGLGMAPGEEMDERHSFCVLLRDCDPLKPWFIADSKVDYADGRRFDPAYVAQIRRYGGVRIDVAEQMFVVAFAGQTPDDPPALAARENVFVALAVAMRTVLERRALKQQREAAKAADRAKDEFLSMMNHELRTPLNHIMGFADILRLQAHGPLGAAAYQEYAEHIGRAGEQLLAVLTDITDLSQLQAGGLKIMPTPCSLADAATMAVRLVTKLARDRGVTLTCSVTDDLPPVYADERRLKQIVLNLVSNAIKFTDADGSVTLSGTLSDDGMGRLTIADTGIGMTRDELALALKPFSQVDHRLARQYEGVGIGLPLTRALVELHGGSLSFDTAKGRGTRVTIAIPLAAHQPAG